MANTSGGGRVQTKNSRGDIGGRWGGARSATAHITMSQGKHVDNQQKERKQKKGWRKELLAVRRKNRKNTAHKILRRGSFWLEKTKKLSAESPRNRAGCTLNHKQKNRFSFNV